MQNRHTLPKCLGIRNLNPMLNIYIWLKMADISYSSKVTKQIHRYQCKDKSLATWQTFLQLKYLKLIFYFIYTYICLLNKYVDIK